MITKRTADKLDVLAQTRGLEVRVLKSTKPRRRWYSVGVTTEGRWHQISGAENPEALLSYIDDLCTSRI